MPTVFGCIALMVLYGIVRMFAADRFRIPTESMTPTLIPGDNVLVDKTLIGARIYTDFGFTKDGVRLRSVRMRGRRKIRHNDIVIFNRANHWHAIKFIINNVYCKRCVGLPGDTVSVVGGHYVNNNYEGVLGVEERQRRLAAMPDSILRKRRVLRASPRDKHVKWTIRDFGPMYVPRKGDLMEVTPETATVYKDILEWEIGKKLDIDWERNRVEAGGRPFVSHVFRHNYYFMAGDNVFDSDDSRYMGPVPEEYIVGIVSHIIHSKNPETGATRWDRVLRAL